MRYQLLVPALVVLVSAGCSGDGTGEVQAVTATTATVPTTNTAPPAPSAIDRVCALNEDFATLNERTMGRIPDMEDGEPIPAQYAGLLEESYVEGASLMRQMVEHAPAAVKADLSAYTRAIAKLSDMYAEYGYDQAATWENADYDAFFADYAVPDQVREGIGAWFIENCGMDLQG